jgi:hypothetical protein
MWWLVTKAILQGLALIVIGELLRPKPKVENPKPNSLGDFNFPTAVEGRTIPVFWGTVKVGGPNVTWYGDLEVEPIKQRQQTGLFSSTKVTIGYKYHFGIQHSIAFGELDEFIGLRIDDKDVTLDNIEVAADYTRFEMNSPTLFGKEKEAGGVTGPVIVYHGTFNQPANEYLAAVLGEDVPAYRPVIHAIYEHCWLGNSGSLQFPEFILRRCPNPLALASGKHNIAGDANPANMVYEILTDKTWGMGIAASLIDADTFVAVGNTLYDESLGLSMFVDNAQSGEALIAEIMRHVDGVLYQDFESGLFRIALVRDDYDEETAPLFDETNIVSGSLEFGRSSWEDTQNTVMIRYLDRAQNFTERVIQHQNLANISARGGKIEAEEYDFLGVSNPTAANVIAARVLRTVSSPLSKVNFEANRDGTTLRPGSVFRLSWSALGITSVVYRVTEIDTGTVDSPAVKITAVEDIFSTGSVAYTAPSASGWVNPVQPPQPVAEQALVEAPYFIAGLTDTRWLLTLAVREGMQELGYQVWSDPAGGTAFALSADNPGFVASAKLEDAYGASTHASDATGFVVYDVDGAGALESITTAERAAGQNLLMIDNEIMGWATVTSLGSGRYRISDVLQAQLDTLPAEHAADARVWFLTEGAGLTKGEPYTSNATVNVKLLPYTVRETLAIGDAVAIDKTLVFRANKPYPPAGMTVNSAYFNDAVIAGHSDLLVLDWNHRDRTQQVDEALLLAGSAANIGPETDVTYTIKLYGELGTLLRTVTGHTSDTYTWTTESADSGLIFGRLNLAGRVVIETYRDGVLAYQNYDFNWTRPTAESATFYLTTEGGDILTTEGGDRLILEF